MFLLAYTNYAALHSTRTVWSAATKDFKNIYNFSDDEVGNMNACFLGAFALSSFFLSQFADKIKLKYLIPAIWCSVAVVMCALGSMQHLFPSEEEEQKHIWMYFALKIINGTLQGPGWAINLVIISNWFPRTGRGLLVGLFATNTSVGDIIGTQVYKHFSEDAATSWSTSFFILAGVVAVVGLMNFFLLIQQPEEVGLKVEENGILVTENVAELDTPTMANRLLEKERGKSLAAKT